MAKARVVYDCYAMGSGHPRAAPDEHPQQVMTRLAGELGFTILGSVAQSIGDCWWFWVEYTVKPTWPAYLGEAEWLPVGTV